MGFGLYAPVSPPAIKPPVISLVNSANLPPDETDGRWPNGIGFLPLNSVLPWADDECATTLDVDALPSPQPPVVTFAAQAGSTLPAGTHVYVITCENANGETLGSTPVSATNPALGDAATIDWPNVTPVGVNGPFTYGVYRDAMKIGTKVAASVFVDTGQPVLTGTSGLPSQNTTGGPGSYPAPGEVDFQVPVFRAWDRCSSFGFEAHQYEQRAKDTLDVGTPAAIEHEFWTGTMAKAANWPNLYLASPSATIISPYASGESVVSVARAIEALEQAIASTGAGGIGMIHCRPEAVPHLTQVRRQGNLLLTARDTIIVAGSGYPNTGPTGAVAPAGQTWLYATGLVDVRIGDITTYPSVEEDGDSWLIEATDRNVNEVVVRAERPAVAVWDGQVHYACLATLDT